MVDAKEVMEDVTNGLGIGSEGCYGCDTNLEVAIEAIMLATSLVGVGIEATMEAMEVVVCNRYFGKGLNDAGGVSSCYDLVR